ncbi:MAG: YceD family protein [Pseudomonadota bacterium]
MQSIDIKDFTRLGSVLVGDVKVSDLSRLQNLIVPGQEELRYELQGGFSARHEPQITCIMRGAISLQCQRCLGSFSYLVDIDATLVFVGSESELPAIEEENESVDYMVAQEKLDLVDLIEEEVILALPFAPRHDEGECDEWLEQEAASDKPSPFAALTKLKRS